MGRSGATIHTEMGRIGRNERCPCGSGKKFKKCCGGPQPAPPADPARVTEGPGLFGSEAAFLTSLLDSFARSAKPHTYRIMPLDEAEALESIAECNQVYWQEILYRAHFGASTALMRLREWLHGSERALADGNVLMLAAGIRGFLEAAADTWQSFSDVPHILADCHMVVRRAIKGECSEQLVLAPELESMLIHFAYARKLKPDEGPALHSATTAKDAISAIEESAPAIGTVYAALCDYAHPAAASVFRFAGEITHPDKVTFDPQARPEKTRAILTLSGEVGRVALVLGAAPVVVTLKVLNSFAFAPVTTPWADDVSLSFSDVWQELEHRLQSHNEPQIATGAERDKLLADTMVQYRPVGKAKRRSKGDRVRRRKRDRHPNGRGEARQRRRNYWPRGTTACRERDRQEEKRRKLSDSQREGRFGLEHRKRHNGREWHWR